MAEFLKSIDDNPARIDGEGRQKDPYGMAIRARQREKKDGGDGIVPTPTSEYDIRRGLSAQDLLDWNVQSFIADEVARKNSRSQLEAMGLANSGFGATASALQGNALSDQLMKNQRKYSDAIAGINAEEAAANQQITATKADLLTQELSQLSGQAIIDYMDRNGFKQENGVWYDPTGRYNKDIMDQINNEIWLRNYAEETTRQTELAETYGVTDATPRLDSAETAVKTITLADGSKGSKVEWELYDLFTNYADRPDGFVARLVNGSNDKQYATLMKIDGQWVQVNDDVYDMTPANSKTQLTKSSGVTYRNATKQYGAQVSDELAKKLTEIAPNGVKAGATTTDLVLSKIFTGNVINPIEYQGKKYTYNPTTKTWHEYK